MEGRTFASGFDLISTQFGIELPLGRVVLMGKTLPASMNRKHDSTFFALIQERMG